MRIHGIAEEYLAIQENEKWEIHNNLCKHFLPKKGLHIKNENVCLVRK